MLGFVFDWIHPSERFNCDMCMSINVEQRPWVRMRMRMQCYDPRKPDIDIDRFTRSVSPSCSLSRSLSM